LIGAAVLSLLLSLAAWAVPADAPATPEVWHITPAESRASFRVRLFAIMPLSGRFAALSGSVRLDRGSGHAEVSAVIDAGSVEMASPDNTEWVRSEEFFDVERYPEIRFDSEPFPLATLRHGGALQGRLELRGRSHPVGFDVAPGTCGAPDAARCTVEVEGTIRRSWFGMRARRGVVSDRVQLRFTIVAQRAGAPEPMGPPA
jgi:polyisoprenoid-binding protein YceI